MSSEVFPSSAALRQIVPLAEKREALLKKVDDLDRQIAELSVSARAVAATTEAQPIRKASGRRKLAEPVPVEDKKDTSAKILGLLKVAGSKGLSIREIASKLGMKAQNVHVWFSFKGRKLADLQKIGQAQWSLKA
ncbi:hypothetical protein TSACC_22832 [Terrimicrobium sacchariphilum]|jgi:cell division septum initiation protein DivIVA|uniref:Uncharacterized protein n=1 Tax=Terrimicrobium sacchariphilum TaxID=690879 RepID=A0A146GCI9_TERSA|nr:hypothetical protein [Terrimicrobium sacchariphilum]GAT34407.1 hypothetical protein TSACC_22832 [Terrimicrobium sacchariphilum]